MRDEQQRLWDEQASEQAWPEDRRRRGASGFVLGAILGPFGILLAMFLLGAILGPLGILLAMFLPAPERIYRRWRACAIARSYRRR